MIQVTAKFFQYCNWNRLTLNLDKSKYMIFNKKSTNKETYANINIKIGKQALMRVDEYKYLGIILERNLNFEQHIKSVKGSISGRMITLKRIRYLLSIKESLLLFKSKIMPYFDQGNLFYNVASKNILHGLQVLQNMFEDCLP